MLFDLMTYYFEWYTASPGRFLFLAGMITFGVCMVTIVIAVIKESSGK